MHGQKKRRKPAVGGVIVIDGLSLAWELVAEPQWASSGGDRKGARVSVRMEGEVRRELMIEYPFPTGRHGRDLTVPIRTQMPKATVEATIREAIDAGWDPTSRGKTFVFQPIADSNE